MKVNSTNDILVMATGIGQSYEDTGGIYSPIKVSVRDISIVNNKLVISFMTSDDATANDGSFGFVVTNQYDWVS